MFIKILKFDINYSKITFLGMAAISIVAAFVVRIANLIEFEGEMEFLAPLLGQVFAVFGSIIVVIISVIQIWRFFSQNFFSDTGYFSLSLPVERWKLLTSKMLISMLWFNFMFITLMLVLQIIDLQGMGNMFIWSNIVMFISIAIYSNAIILMIISILFFAITLANSTIFNKHIHGIISGILATGYALFAFWVLDNFISSRASSAGYIRLGTRIQETPFGVWEIPVIVDYFLVLGAIGFALIPLSATLYLLKHKITLK